MTVLEVVGLVKELFQAGGFVMPPLFICVLLLWYGLGYRFWVLRSPKKMGVRDMLDFYRAGNHRAANSIVEQAIQIGVELKKKHTKYLRYHLDTAFYDFEREIGKFSVLVKTIIIISPLLGLLGTVVGMVETFDSLASMVLFSQTGGIAGGIAQALITTQMGLAVAIPGLLMHNDQNKKQQQIEKDLVQIKYLLCSQPFSSIATARKNNEIQ